jgi:hypothetical protein
LQYAGAVRIGSRLCGLIQMGQRTACPIACQPEWQNTSRSMRRQTLAVSSLIH